MLTPKGVDTTDKARTVQGPLPPSPRLSTSPKMDLPTLHAQIVPYDPAQYLFTTNTANKVSRQAKIVGSSNIMLGGKVIIHPGAVIRGDLARAVRVAAATTTVPGAGSGGTGEGAAQNVVPEPKGVERITISTGRYCVIGEGVVLRPPWRVYKGWVGVPQAGVVETGCHTDRSPCLHLPPFTASSPTTHQRRANLFTSEPTAS